MSEKDIRRIQRFGQAWMDMIKSRALTIRTYNQEVADAIADAVFKTYYPEFTRPEKTFQSLADKDVISHIRRGACTFYEQKKMITFEKNELFDNFTSFNREILIHALQKNAKG